MSEPFLIPLVKWFVPHFKEVHLLGGDQLGVNGNEMVFKVFLECFPYSETGGRGQEGSFLAIFCPFAGRGIPFKQGEGGGNSFFHIGVYVSPTGHSVFTDRSGSRHSWVAPLSAVAA